ncbi:hypothetical protein WA158_007345 [Blastocystis sp. Blastoise]
MVDKDSVLTVMDKRQLIVPCLDRKQLSEIASVVTKHKNILGYQWTPDARRIVKRTDYDVKEATFLTTFAIITPMIFIKWLTLWKRVGLSCAVGIPTGYLIGQNDRRKGLTNLCDTTDPEIGRRLRESIFAKGYTSVASQYLIARGYGGLSYPAPKGDISRLKITDDYERSGKAYTKLVILEGSLSDIVYVLNHITIQDVKVFALSNCHVGVEGRITPCKDQYKAIIKVHSVPKNKSKQDKTYNLGDMDDIRNDLKIQKHREEEAKIGINKQMEGLFTKRKEMNEIEKEVLDEIKQKVLKSTIEEVSAKQLKEVQERVKEKYGNHHHVQSHKEQKQQQEKEKEEELQEIQEEIRDDFEKNIKQNYLDTSKIIPSVDNYANIQKNRMYAKMYEQEIEEEEEEEDFDYLYEDLLGSPVPPSHSFSPKEQELDYFDPMFEDVLGTPIPLPTPTHKEENGSQEYAWEIEEGDHTPMDIKAYEKKQLQRLPSIPNTKFGLFSSQGLPQANERRSGFSEEGRKAFKD